jgi:hypothetical protein
MLSINGITQSFFNVYPQKEIPDTLYESIRNITQTPTSYHNIIKMYEGHLAYTSAYKDGIDILFSPTRARENIKLLTRIQKHRWILRRFLQFWRIKRMKCPVNEDIYTMESILNPIYIVDWNIKQKFAYEAKTIHRDICERLLHSEGMYSVPLYPRNPLTNNPLTQTQLISVWEQLSYSRINLSFVISGFIHSKWMLDLFGITWEIPLRLHCLKNILNKDDAYGEEDVLDFIERMYRKTRIPFYTKVYKYMLTSDISHKYLDKWRIYCYEYYKLFILYKNNDVLFSTKCSLLMKDVYKLIKECNLFIEIFNKKFSTKLPFTNESYILIEEVFVGFI